MRLTVKVKAKARENSIIVKADNYAVVSVTAPAAKGKANKVVIEALAGHFRKPKSKIMLLRGQKSREKIFEIVS